MDRDAPIVLDSASRHGITEVGALHAWTFAIDVYDIGGGMVMYIGPDRAGNLTEVGVVDWHDDIAIVHTVRARPRYLR